jgi:hypothetical protein
MPGLKKNKWKYAEMVMYLPYIRSVSDSVFISIQNMNRENVLLDDLQVEFIKMQGPTRHDWILSSDDVTDSSTIFQTSLEMPPEAPWGNSASISSQMAFSGSKSSCILPSSPYSVVFEKEMSEKKDGYFRVSSRISGDTSSLVYLVFDFSAKGKTVFYKTYPVKLKVNNSNWNLTEIFREFPVRSINADKVKIYYWLTKGNNPVYIDDLQVDIVNYKPAKRTVLPQFPANKNAETILKVCCDFEHVCQPETGFQPEVSNAFSGSKVCLIDREHPFSFSHLLPLTVINDQKNTFVYVTAQVSSDHYSTGATLVADFRNKGKSVSYKPAYLRGQTIKGEWNSINFGFDVPENITASDSVLMYFYMPKRDEVLLIDDFCVSIKK